LKRIVIAIIVIIMIIIAIIINTINSSNKYLKTVVKIMKIIFHFRWSTFKKATINQIGVYLFIFSYRLAVVQILDGSQQ
jgi:hypothetical protein